MSQYRDQSSFEKKSGMFWRDTAVALGLSILGAVIFSVSIPIVGQGAGARIVLVLLSLLYLLTLLKKHKVRLYSQSGDLVSKKGWLVSLCIWALVVGVLVFFNPGILVWLVMLVGLVWLIRCLRCYNSLLMAAGDAVVNGLALFLALATAVHTHSVFLSLWAFFLIQACVVFLPGFRLNSRRSGQLQGGDHDFDRACRTAESALQRMSAQR